MDAVAKEAILPAITMDAASAETILSCGSSFSCAAVETAAAAVEMAVETALAATIAV